MGRKPLNAKYEVFCLRSMFGNEQDSWFAITNNQEAWTLGSNWAVMGGGISSWVNTLRSVERNTPNFARPLNTCPKFDQLVQAYTERHSGQKA